MRTDKQIILTSKIKDLQRQLSSHSSAKSRAKNDKQKQDFEQTCIDDCKERIENAREELKGL